MERRIQRPGVVNVTNLPTTETKVGRISTTYSAQIEPGKVAKIIIPHNVDSYDIIAVSDMGQSDEATLMLNIQLPSAEIISKLIPVKTGIPSTASGQLPFQANSVVALSMSDGLGAVVTITMHRMGQL